MSKNSRYAPKHTCCFVSVKVAYISSFSAIILFKLINEFGKINPIRNLIINVDNISAHLIKLFAVLKVSFESCIFSLVNKLFHFSIVLHSRLSVKGEICFYTIRKYSFCSMDFSEFSQVRKKQLNS